MCSSDRSYFKTCFLDFFLVFGRKFGYVSRKVFFLLLILYVPINEKKQKSLHLFYTKKRKIEDEMWVLLSRMPQKVKSFSELLYGELEEEYFQIRAK